ncbi:hypothetical protein GOBAR_DD16661 [Gossypium barbadense]|nr:hypothetical protein GOBAR_DD16661 [Gossypium barbadense]
MVHMPTVAWNDKLVGTSSIAEKTNKFLEMDLDYELEFDEGDIKNSYINGVPAIDFSKRINQFLVKDMTLTVVVKLLGKSIGFTTLQNRISNLWRPSKPFHLMDIENGYYLVKFQNKKDYGNVLSQGPWIIFGQYLTIQPWYGHGQDLYPNGKRNEAKEDNRFAEVRNEKSDRVIESTGTEGGSTSYGKSSNSGIRDAREEQQVESIHGRRSGTVLTSLGSGLVQGPSKSFFNGPNVYNEDLLGKTTAGDVFSQERGAFKG